MVTPDALSPHCPSDGGRRDTLPLFPHLMPPGNFGAPRNRPHGPLGAPLVGGEGAPPSLAKRRGEDGNLRARVLLPRAVPRCGLPPSAKTRSSRPDQRGKQRSCRDTDYRVPGRHTDGLTRSVGHDRRALVDLICQRIADRGRDLLAGLWVDIGHLVAQQLTRGQRQQCCGSEQSCALQSSTSVAVFLSIVRETT